VLLTVLSLLISRRFGFHRRSRSRVTNSRIKLSKIAALTNFQATKNSISVPTLVSRLTTLAHCRDKIEFNLKSQKFEELTAFRAAPLTLREEHFRYSLLLVNENFEFLQLFSSPAFRATAHAAPLSWRGAQSRHSPLLVNENFEFLQLFSSPAV